MQQNRTRKPAQQWLKRGGLGAIIEHGHHLPKMGMSKYIEGRKNKQENGYFVLFIRMCDTAIGSSGWKENGRREPRAPVHWLHQACVDNHKWSLGSGKWCVNVIEAIEILFQYFPFI